jgi:hypothetical protein
MPEVRILVRVRGFKGSVVPVLTDFMNAIVPQHGGVAMDDPKAFDRDGYISETIEVRLDAARDEDDARAITRSVIDQIPGASEVLSVGPR